VASTELNAAGDAVLPPGAPNVEDDIRAWEALERREKWKLMIVRVILAIVLLSIWEYGTDRWFDALWFSSPLRVLRHLWDWAQDDLLKHLVITLRETFIGYSCGTLLGIAMGVLLARFDGSLSGPQKDAAIAAFRDSASVLLCTQSGGEGRNIQFCNTLINFDVPWNPMAIEQRIGRIDRIGQNREVFVFNLVTRGTLEEQILALLDEKISMFELVVGEVGAILGGLEEEREFPDLVLDAWLGATEAARSLAFEALGQRLEQARQQHEDAKALDEKLFGEDFETA
jgi:hypothetical protein